LRWVFADLVYPTLLIAAFVYLVATTVRVVVGGRGDALLRRLMGALLPFVALVYVVVAGQIGDPTMAGLFPSLGGLAWFGIGGAIGLLLLEASRPLLSARSEVGPSLYALFLSTVASFMLYCQMIEAVKSTQAFPLGMIVCGGLDVMFRGAPGSPWSRHTVVERPPPADLGSPGATYSPPDAAASPASSATP